MSHNHTFRHAGSYKYRVALTFVKPRGGEGQNGQLRCPLDFLVFYKDIFYKNVEAESCEILRIF